MLLRALAVLFTLALGAAARAEDDAAQALLGSLAEKDPRVLGRSYFGLHAGKKNVGWAVLDVTATTSGSASYHVHFEARAALGDEGNAIAERGLLDRRLAPALLDELESDGPRKDLAVARHVAKADRAGAFDVHVPALKARPRARVTPARPLVEGVAARVALVRALDAKKKATYRACVLEPGETVLRDAEVEVAAAPEDGLWPVVLKVPATGETTRFLVAPDAPPAKRVVRWRRLDQELEYVLAPDEAGARKDLPPAERPPEGSPRATLLGYLEAVEKRDARRLEPLIEWAALQRSLGEKGELGAWKKSFLEQMAAREEDPDHGARGTAADLIEKLREDPVAPDALEARVRIEGEKGVFKLVREKAGAPWKIAQLPE